MMKNILVLLLLVFAVGCSTDSIVQPEATAETELVVEVNDRFLEIDEFVVLNGAGEFTALDNWGISAREVSCQTSCDLLYVGGGMEYHYHTVCDNGNEYWTEGPSPGPHGSCFP